MHIGWLKFLVILCTSTRASPVAQQVKNLLQCRRQRTLEFDPWIKKIPWRRKWKPTPVFLPGKCHGQGSLTGYSPKGPKESDKTEGLQAHPQKTREALQALTLDFSKF